MKAKILLVGGLLNLLVFTGLSFLANADVPPLINYQGQLTDANGNPQTGIKKLEFNIYDASSGGNKIWGPQTFATVPLINGRFNVLLGTTDAKGMAITSAFGAGNRYLGISVDNAVDIVPRQQILSTPFAVQAQHAVEADHSTNADNANNAANSLHAQDAGKAAQLGNDVTIDSATGKLTSNVPMKVKSGGYEFPNGSIQTTASNPYCGESHNSADFYTCDNYSIKEVSTSLPEGYTLTGGICEVSDKLLTADYAQPTSVRNIPSNQTWRCVYQAGACRNGTYFSITVHAFGCKFQ